MINQDFDLDRSRLIQSIKRDYRISLFLRRKELVIRLGNAFENMISNPKSICEEIKNSLEEEMADNLILARQIEHQCPDKWKNEIERMSDLSTADIVDCKRCDRPMKSHFYQFYHNRRTKQHYMTGLITSTDEVDRYDFVAGYGNCEVYQPPHRQFEHLPCVKKEILCPECYWETAATNIDVIHLCLDPDSFNAELASYMSTLPDLSHYSDPPDDSVDEGCFGLGDAFLFEMRAYLNIAFAEENVTFERYSRACLDDLQKNFIEDKARRYPNDEELTRWMRKQMGDEIIKFKIFDVRRSNFICSNIVRRFVVIVHLLREGGPWGVLYVPDKWF